MKIDDEVLNRYLDGELQGEELKEFEKLLSSSPELNKKMNLLKTVDLSLRSIAQKTESPSPQFTASVMSRLRGRSSFAKSQNYFFIFVAGIITLLSVAITGYFAAELIPASRENLISVPDMSGYLDFFTNKLTILMEKISSPENLSLMGSLISCILIVSGYFFFDNLKQLKKISR